MTKARRGVYAAALTPVGADGRPDTNSWAAYCADLLRRGLDGVAPLGTTGEGVSLPYEWRLAAPEALAAAGLPADRVILGTGAAATDDAIAFTRAGLSVGYGNALALPPFYLKGVSEDGVYAHYARLIDGVNDDRLRLYLYHFPQMSQVPIPISLIRRLRAAYGPIIAGLKDSSGDFAGTLDFVSAVDDFDVFPSNEGVLLEGRAKGCAGVISATTNASAELVRMTLDASGAEQADLQDALTEIRQIIARYPLSAALKEVEATVSGDETWRAVFPPLVPLDEAQRYI